MKFITILSLALLTSCATKPNWHNRHYQNNNKAAEANVLCNSGQFSEALKLGYTCKNDPSKNSNVNRAISSSNGNVNNIYMSGYQNGYNRQNKAPGVQMFDVMNTIYQQERNDRLNRICTFNGTCKN